MNSTLKIRVPFFRRSVNGDGTATFFLNELPTYLPTPNQTVLISHSSIEENSNLSIKLSSLSTNIVAGDFIEAPDSDSVDGFTNFFRILYNQETFTPLELRGESRGYIEYDVNPEIYSVLKPIESAQIVSESIPFNLTDGISNLTSKVVSGDTYPSNIIKGCFVKRGDTNSVFSNLLKSLNLPVSEEEIKKYTRSKYGNLNETPNGNILINGRTYQWTEYVTGSTNNLVVHPITGWTGEYYNTVLQTIGSYEFNKTDKSLTPIKNDLYLIFEIPNGFYGEIIDGKTVKLSLPHYTGSASDPIDQNFGVYTYTGTPFEISCYGTYNKKNLSNVELPSLNTTVNGKPLDRVLSEIDLSLKDLGIKPNLESVDTYESNVVLLFSDEIKPPTNISFSSWSDGYTDLIDGVKVFNINNVKKATYDYNNDECVGFVALDKGFIVITHPIIVDSYFKNIFNGDITVVTNDKIYDVNGVLSNNTNRGLVETDPTNMITTLNNNGDVIWDSTQFVFRPIFGSTEDINSDLQFISYNTEKSLNIVCLASTDEFFKSTNDTAKELLSVDFNSDFANFKTEDQNLYPVIITQLGIHDEEGNLLAICKPTQPIKKYWFDVVSFNIRIRL